MVRWVECVAGRRGLVGWVLGVCSARRRTVLGFWWRALRFLEVVACVGAIFFPFFLLFISYWFFGSWELGDVLLCFLLSGFLDRRREEERKSR